jgi:hypothetical protein
MWSLLRHHVVWLAVIIVSENLTASAKFCSSGMLSSGVRHSKKNLLGLLEKMGLIGSPEMLVDNYHFMLHNIPEEQRSHFTLQRNPEITHNASTFSKFSEHGGCMFFHYHTNLLH